MRVQVEDALSELVARGRVTADAFRGLRALLTPQSKRPSFSSRRRRRATGGGFETARRVAAPGSRRIVYRDGVAVAALTGAGIDWLGTLTPAEQYRAQELLRRAGGRPGSGATRRAAGLSRSV